MTFPGPDRLPDLTGVPAALDGHPEARAAGEVIAKALGMRPLEVPGDRRLYHAAAVLAGNFSTVLLHEASRTLAAAGVPLSEAPGLLAPLAMQSLRNAVEHGPAASLTGPAARGDVTTLQGHRDALVAAGLADIVDLYDPATRAAMRMGTTGPDQS